ncbi:MAG: PilT/PilU family type 4a pilus ATPase [Candidatus Omnitrophica bacterium]|nr:PilT/PilU family type 4a pilus ATPase [Candidatus Omnitrophota bacterium]
MEYYNNLLDLMIEKKATDIFLRVGSNIRGRINTSVEVIRDEVLTIETMSKIVEAITDDAGKEKLKSCRACEFTHWHHDYPEKDCWRFRVGIFYQRNTPAIVVRKIDLNIPDFRSLNLPPELLKNLSNERRGIVLLTGITGSGKSTTIASMMKYINENLKRHVLTVEEPIEFTFKDKKSVINQRELGIDVGSYNDALKQFALHSPDVIYIGNIRDAETCHAALTAAETGVLVFSTLHTVNATSTVERIINFFPPHHHALIMDQLSFLLKGVLSQRLLPLADGSGLIPAYEAMVLSPSVSRLIRENKIWEIPRYLAEGDIYRMKTFHQCLVELVESGKVTFNTAIEYADKKEELELALRNKGLMQ